MLIDCLQDLLDLTTLNTETGCLEWTKYSCTSAGYGQLPYQGKMHYAHRLSYQMANGVYLGKDNFVCHKCDNPKCINPEHLFLGDAKTNIQDMYAKGREHKHHYFKGDERVKGENNKASKLTVDAVKQIKQLLSSLSYGVLAKQFGVSKAAIYNIAKGKTWNFV
jgi:hypothetical protein